MRLGMKDQRRIYTVHGLALKKKKGLFQTKSNLRRSQLDSAVQRSALSLSVPLQHASLLFQKLTVKNFTPTVEPTNAHLMGRA